MVETIKIIFSSVWSWIRPILFHIHNFVDKDDFFTAYQIVKRYYYADKSSEEKRIAATQELKERLLRHGKKLSSSLVNLLVELAYQRIKIEMSK